LAWHIKRKKQRVTRKDILDQKVDVDGDEEGHSTLIYSTDAVYGADAKNYSRRKSFTVVSSTEAPLLKD
jgi:hypothetical protein